MIKPRNTPPCKPPKQPIYVQPHRKDGKSKTYLLWILEYLKAKNPEDKDAINAVIEVVMKEL